MTKTLTRDVLSKALDILETHGWHQGASVSPDGQRVCALGALHCATYDITPQYYQKRIKNGDPYSSSESLAHLRWAAQLALTSVIASTDGIVTWNDDPTREFHEVRDAFKRAIDA